MGACVKLASAQYGSGEIVMYRGVAGALIIGAVSRWRGDSLRTKVPAQHFLRGSTGVVALCLWFYALGELQLATAMTLNYTSSLWLAPRGHPAAGRATDNPSPPTSTTTDDDVPPTLTIDPQ